MKRLACLLTWLCVAVSLVQAGPIKPAKITKTRVSSAATRRVVADPLRGGPSRQTVTSRPSLERKPVYIPPQLKTPTLTKQPSSHLRRPWVVRQARNLQALKIRMQRLQRDKALREQQLLDQAKAALPPLLPSDRLYVKDSQLLDMLPNTHPIDLPFLSILMDNKKLAQAVTLEDSNVSALPFTKEPNAVYRGMALAPQDIRAILTDGIQRKNTESSNRYNISMSAGSHGAIRYFSSHPVVNATSFPEHARFWGAKFLGSKPILTVTKIRSRSSSAASIINLDRDIAPDEIVEMVALLKVNGKATWCRVQLHNEIELQVTPYQWRSPVSK